MSKLIKKLRSYHPTSGYSATMRKAADEIERLEAALLHIAEWPNGGNSYGQDNIKQFATIVLKEK